MKKFQYTCKCLVDKTGYRAESIEKAVNSLISKRHVCCSTEKILLILLERWTRQGNGIFTYYLSPNDILYNNQLTPIDYIPLGDPALAEIAWYGVEQHSYEYIKVVTD